MRLTPAAVRAERDRLREGAAAVVPLVNDTRDALGDLFGTDVAAVTTEEYRAEVDVVFADGDRAVNVAALCGILRDLDVEGDYPGFVVDELLGRELAATIAGEQPLALLAEATFHFADVHTHGGREARSASDGRAAESFETASPSRDDGSRAAASEPPRDDGEATAGADDLDAALAAGFQTRLPGWEWTEAESPFAVDPTEE